MIFRSLTRIAVKNEIYTEKNPWVFLGNLKEKCLIIMCVGTYLIPIYN